MQQPAHRLDDDREIIPVVEEQAVVRKRKRLTSGVRVRTIVHEDEQVIDEPMRHRAGRGGTYSPRPLGGGTRAGAAGG